MTLLKRTIHPTDFADVLRQLGLFLSTGISPSEAVEIIHAGEKTSSSLAKLLKEMQHDLAQGVSLADSLGNMPKYLHPFQVELIKSATEDELPAVLESVSDFMDYIHLDNKKIKAALTYPVIVLGIALLLTVGILLFVIPVFQEMFASMGGSLPVPTQFVVDLSYYVKQNFLYLVCGTYLLYAVYRYADKKWSGVNRLKCLAIRNLPLYGRVHILRRTHIFLRTISFMIESGKSLPTAMQAAADTADPGYYREAVLQLRDKVIKGKNLGELLFNSNLFPRQVASALTIDSKSEAFILMLNRLEERLQMQLNNATKVLEGAVEPVMMIFLGGVIGGLVISMYLPIFTMADAI
jgi:type IV pilus assembly protein PilC